MTKRPEVTKPDFLYDAQRGFYAYCALCAALENRLFEHLLKPASSREVAALLDRGHAPVRKLLEALASLGLVRKRDGVYANTPLAEAYCLEASEMSQVEYFRFTHETFGGPLYEAAAGLTACESLAWEQQYDVGRGVEAGAGFALPSTVEEVMAVFRGLDCFERARSLLDLGCGPAMFGMAASGLKPDLQVSVFDLPTAITHTRRVAERLGKTQELRFLEGDMLKDDLGGPYDIIFSSDCLYMARHCLDDFLPLLKRQLVQGGALVLRHGEITHDETSPPVNALLEFGAELTGFGDFMFRQGVLPEALERAGFTRIKTVRQDHMTHRYAIHVAQAG